MNRIVLLGRLVRDPEVRYTNTGKVVCQFTLAVDRPFTGQNGQREADFIPVLLWGKQAETAGNSLWKGHRTLVEGRLQIRSYDAKDGSKRYVSEVIADRFEFIEKKADSQYNQAQRQEQPPQEPPPQESYYQPSSFDSFGTTVPQNEEIPF